MAYTEKQLRIKRQNRQMMLRELHPDWNGEMIYFELQRKWGIPRKTAERDWKILRAEMAERAKAEQEGGNDETA